MDNGLIQEKPKEQLVYYPKSNTFREDLDNKATMRGFDAYVEGEKKNRLTRSIERLSRHTNLSKDELQRLKDSVTEEPMFGTEEGAEFKTLLTKAQKKQLGYFKKKRYNKKEAAYKAQLGTWEFENLSKLYEQEERVYKRFYEAEVAEVTLEDKVDSIDKEFFAQSDKFFMLDEDKKAKADEQKLLDIGIKKQVKAYTGRKYKAYNRYLRDPSYSKISEEDKKDVYTNYVHTHHCDIFLEEPEADLFPPTQSNLVEWLLEMTKGEQPSNLFIATHSPYILNAFLEKQDIDITLLYTRISDGQITVKTATEQDIQDIYDYGVDAFFNIETLG